MILEGRVRVNGVIVRELGTKVDPDKDRIAVDGKTLEAQPKHYYLFNKPKGVITTSSDDQGRATVMDYFRKEKDRIYAVGRLDSSTSTRCVQTFKPYAKASGLEVRGWSTLSEELAKGNDKAVTKLMRRLVAEASGARMPTAVCGHRPVLPTMLVALGVEPHSFQTSAVLVAHLDAAGAVVASEFHKPLV